MDESPTTNYSDVLDSLKIQLDDLSKSKDIPKWYKNIFDTFRHCSTNIVDYTKKLETDIATLKQANYKLKDTVKVQQTVTNVLCSEKNRLNEAVSKLQIDLDDLEQYSRRNCLLIHGLEEEDNENTTKKVLKVFKNKLGLSTDLSESDITRSHRLGKKSSNKTRPIIAKFISYQPRSEVYRNKKKLKGTKLTITENLTKRRVSLLNSCKSTFGKHNVWTNDGRIFCKIDDEISLITNEDDIAKIDIPADGNH